VRSVREGNGIKTELWSCCIAVLMAPKKSVHPLSASLKKPHGLKALRHYPYDYKSHKKTWVTGRFSSECLASFEKKKMAHQDRNMLLLIEPCAAHSEKGTTLKHFHQLYPLPNITSYMQPLDHNIIYSRSEHTEGM
jgi:hypothetical protein